jgi:hypothetical protein
MATFVPPIADGILIADPAKRETDGAHALWSHYGAWAMGVTVWKDQAGVWHESLVPYQGGGMHVVFENGVQISSSGPDEGLATAQRVYEGGHVHPITPEEEAELIAAGYAANIEP